MDISTEFDLAETVYAIEDSGLGKMIPLIVEKIIINVETIDITTITYQVSSNNKFHNTTYYENEIESLTNAQTRAETYLNGKIDDIQEIIDSL